MAVELGLGLLSIGRAWGHVPGDPPPEKQAHDLLQAAVDLGVRVFDTAPAYGASEAIFGRFLQTGGAGGRALRIATKMGEHWIEADATTRVDHSYDALMGSLARSLARLGHIDLLQVHKANAQNVTAVDTLRVIEQARAAGVSSFGASVSDVATGMQAIKSGVYGALQFPFNVEATALESLIAAATEAGVALLLNRPYAMGRIQAEASDKQAAMVAAMRFIRARRFDGVVLTGTRTPEHLRQSVAAFAAAAP